MNHLFIIQGATAVGKTDVAIDLAQRLATEIISCDSRQFFCEMSIGTAVPSPEQLQAVPHHCVHHKSIHDYYNVYQFEHDALAALEQIFVKTNRAVMVGGSGMYIDTLVRGIDQIPDPEPELRQEVNAIFEQQGIEGLRRMLYKLDPDYYQTVDLRNHARLIRAIEVSLQTGQAYSSFRQQQHKQRSFAIYKIGISMDRELLYSRINQRVDVMMEQGLLQEVQNLEPFKQLTPLNTVGYKELFAYLQGDASLPQAIEQIKQNTRRYAKKQTSWFNRYPEIEWFETSRFEQLFECCAEKLK